MLVCLSIPIDLGGDGKSKKDPPPTSNSTQASAATPWISILALTPALLPCDNSKKLNSSRKAYEKEPTVRALHAQQKSVLGNFIGFTWRNCWRTRRLSSSSSVRSRSSCRWKSDFTHGNWFHSLRLGWWTFPICIGLYLLSRPTRKGLSRSSITVRLKRERFDLELLYVLSKVKYLLNWGPFPLLGNFRIEGA